MSKANALHTGQGRMCSSPDCLTPLGSDDDMTAGVDESLFLPLRRTTVDYVAGRPCRTRDLTLRAVMTSSPCCILLGTSSRG
jgi:hypothetical protein